MQKREAEGDEGSLQSPVEVRSFQIRLGAVDIQHPGGREVFEISCALSISASLKLNTTAAASHSALVCTG